MNENLHFVQQQQLARTKAALEQNNMEAYIVATTAEVLPLIEQLVPAGATVSNGGSETLVECGVMDHLRSGRYHFLDRDAPSVDKHAIFRASFSADAYISSANAVTQQGEIFEVDGNANRVAAIAYGPASVILVVGKNKLVPDIDAARQRNCAISGPANARRVGAATPCVPTGVCSDCQSPDRICCTELILKQQRVKNRIKVILVDEDLGF